jgi:hypothetical protein
MIFKMTKVKKVKFKTPKMALVQLQSFKAMNIFVSRI